MVVVEQVMEAKKQDKSCTGASTSDEVHSTEVVAEHKSEMNELQEEHDIEMDTTKEGMWTRKDEHSGPKKAWKWRDRGRNRSGLSLAFPASEVWVHVASFGSDNRVVQWLLRPRGMQL